MRLVVFGANGRVGQIVTAQALERGHQIAAAVHSSCPFNDKHPGLIVTEVDVFDDKSVSSALINADAVISCLGSWGTESKNILSQGMKNIIPVMTERGIKRIVSLTGSAAFAPNDSPNILDKVNHRILRTFAAPIVDDAELHLQLLAESSLDWTVLRSPVMNNFGQSDYDVTNNSPLPTQTINRHAVATALVDLVESNEYLRQAPFITRN